MTIIEVAIGPGDAEGSAAVWADGLNVTKWHDASRCNKVRSMVSSTVTDTQRC